MPEGASEIARAEFVEIEEGTPRRVTRTGSTLHEEPAPPDEELSELCEAMVFDNQIVE